MLIFWWSGVNGFLEYFNVYNSIIYSVQMQIFRKKNDIFTLVKLKESIFSTQIYQVVGYD